MFGKAVSVDVWPSHIGISSLASSKLTATYEAFKLLARRSYLGYVHFPTYAVCAATLSGPPRYVTRSFPCILPFYSAESNRVIQQNLQSLSWPFTVATEMVSPLVTAAVAGAAVGMVVYHTLNSRLASSATEEAMTESGGGLQTMAERLLQLEGRRSFEEVLKSVLLVKFADWQ